MAGSVMGELLTEFTAVIELDRYDDIREALFNPELSRTFDKRAYHEGNIRDGIVSISHGAVHRARRRVENQTFRPDELRLYERDLFPDVLRRILDRYIEGERVDLFPLGETLSSVLAARRAGLDVDPDDPAQLAMLVRHVDAFSQGSAILDAKDPEYVRRYVYDTYVEFEREFVRPAWVRRAELIERHRRGEIAADDLPRDILTVLLLHRDDPKIELGDDQRIVREVATYLQGGTHTAAQTLTNAVDLMFAVLPEQPDVLERCAADLLFSQRVVHETLRLRMTTPKVRRRAEAATTVAGRDVPKDALVILDGIAGNRDPKYFGAHPERFDPDREVDPSVARWGLAFGAGPHQCPGRVVAGGLPVPGEFEVDDGHLFGLVALEIQEVCRRGIRPDPDGIPERDPRTDRDTRWAHYPVRFTARAGVPTSR